MTSFLSCTADVIADLRDQAQREQAERDVHICRALSARLDMHGARHCAVSIAGAAGIQLNDIAPYERVLETK